jgi:hypothetical protein
VPRGDSSLIDEIESDALDDNVPVTTALRKCVSLGGRSASEALRDWATRELKGYTPEDELPAYRVVPAPLMVDAVNGNVQITGQQYPASALPEAAREHITEQVNLYDGAGGIAALLKQPQIKLQPPGGSLVVRLMNAENNDPFQHVVSLYWSVSHAAIEGVLDQIRTALTQLVAELRANMSPGQELPTPEAANQAINVVVTGRRSKVNVAAAQASGTGTSAVTTTHSPKPEESRFWTRSRRIGGFIVGCAAVAAAAVAIIEFIH